MINGFFRDNKVKKTIVLGTAIVFALTFFVIAFYVRREQKLQIYLTERRLIETTEHNAAMVRMIFDDYADTLRALSVYISHVDDLRSADTMAVLKNMAEAFNIKRLSIGFPNDSVYTTDGAVYDVPDSEYLPMIENGQFFVTNVVNSIIDGAPIVRIHVPIVRNGEAVATLSSSVEVEDLNNAIKALFPYDHKYFSIVDEYGRYVSINAEENFAFDVNFFESLDAMEYNKGFNKQRMADSFVNLTSGHIEYFLNGEIRYGYYAPVGINNWVMLTVVPSDVVDADVNRFVTRSLMLSAQIALIIIAMLLVIYYQQSRMNAITELNERCFRILAEHTGKIVLEWNYREKSMYYSRSEKSAGQRPNKNIKVPDEVINCAINAGTVHQDDHDMFKKMLADISGGLDLENLRIRLRADNGDYEYYSISTVVVSDTKGKPYKSIGFLENIDGQVRKEEQLRQKANIDQLTGFYNKAASEELISEMLSSTDESASHALFCIDIDNFKSINDDFGHLYGDRVLKELAESIKSLFRKSDILGRFGGDEFVIFVPNIPNVEFIEAKAADLVKCLNRWVFRRFGPRARVKRSTSPRKMVQRYAEAVHR